MESGLMKETTAVLYKSIRLPSPFLDYSSVNLFPRFLPIPHLSWKHPSSYHSNDAFSSWRLSYAFHRNSNTCYRWVIHLLDYLQLNLMYPQLMVRMLVPPHSKKQRRRIGLWLPSRYATRPKWPLPCLNVACQAGYRHIDTASWYETEKSVGLAVKESGLKREEVFITTKLRYVAVKTAYA